MGVVSYCPLKEDFCAMKSHSCYVYRPLSGGLLLVGGLFLLYLLMSVVICDRLASFIFIYVNGRALAP